MHCGDQRHAGCALVGDPARAVGECRDVAKAQPYNMEYKIIKKIEQNMTGIEADIPGINLTPNRWGFRYNALAPAIVNVNNDVTIPFNSVTSQ